MASSAASFKYIAKQNTTALNSQDSGSIGCRHAHKMDLEYQRLGDTRVGIYSVEDHKLYNECKQKAGQRIKSHGNEGGNMDQRSSQTRHNEAGFRRYCNMNVIPARLVNVGEEAGLKNENHIRLFRCIWCYCLLPLTTINFNRRSSSHTYSR